MSGESAGLHIILDFPKRIKEEQLVTLAAEKGVKVYPFHDYFIGKNRKGTRIILGFARLTEKEIQKGVSLLIEAWEPVLISQDI